MSEVHIPTPLRSYTSASIVQADGATLAELFADLERRYPGIRFRVINEQGRLREHIHVFVDRESVRDLATALRPDSRIDIIPAISGG